MQRIHHCPQLGSQAMTSGPMLVQSPIRMPATHLPPTDDAPLDSHELRSHLQPPEYGQLGRIHRLETLLRQWPVACGIHIQQEAAVHRSLGDFFSLWGFTVVEGTRARLGYWRLEFSHPSALAKRGSLSLPNTFEAFGFSRQDLVARPQLGNLAFTARPPTPAALHDSIWGSLWAQA
jgi:hypothetical protein